MTDYLRAIRRRVSRKGRPKNFDRWVGNRLEIYGGKGPVRLFYTSTELPWDIRKVSKAFPGRCDWQVYPSFG